MPIILNIDTSSKYCSVALAQDGEVITGFESANEMDHSTILAPFVKKCMESLTEKNLTLDAVSVSGGPGSYTGLRIGLSLAKGLCFSKDVPLITISTLEILAVRAMFSYSGFTGEELIVPMIDARRMEVYTGVFDSALNKRLDEQPMILDENSLCEFYDNKLLIFIGDGSEKFKNLYKGNNGVWLDAKYSHAKYMVPLSEKLYRNNKFADVAYSTPNYLKDYQTTVSKKIL